MKRRSFLTLLGVTAAAGTMMPKSVFASQHVVDVQVKPRGDHSWLVGRAGACAAAGRGRLKWGVYFKE